MKSQPPESGVLTVLVVLPALPTASELAPAPWFPGLCRQLDRLFGGELRLSFLAPACVDGSVSLHGWPVHRFRPGLRPLAAAETGADLLARLAKPLGRPAAAAYWASGTRKAAALAREQPFDLIHAHWPSLTGLIARAAGSVRGCPVVTASSTEEIGCALPDAVMMARLEREWGTSDLLLGHDPAAVESVMKRSGRRSDPLPELESGREEPEQVQRYADLLLDAWDRAALRGAVRSRPGRRDDGSELRNRF